MERTWHAIGREWMQSDAHAVRAEGEGEQAAGALIATKTIKGEAGDERGHEDRLEGETPESKMPFKSFDSK